MSTSTMTGTDLGPALDKLPLFPLPQVALFPGALMPLHVFEPRYRQMMADILDGHRSLSIVQVTDDAPDMAGHPSIAEVAGVGTIVEHMELPGGRYNI
ncbi:MAG: LON peptidase substrate-binding domain-containing protein, partial [Myxococcota bacterium]